MAEYLSEEDMNTGEYISRDLALRQLNATCLATDCDNYNGVRCRACAYADAMDFIDAIPAADVQPVKHGRWETWGYVFHGIEWKRCSVCGKTADISYRALLEGRIEPVTPSFCGCCGARMDLKGGETE